MKISIKKARQLALKAQLLNGRNKLPSGKEGAARVIEKLGYVQIDTIAVIERAHNHTLWTRYPDYRPEMLLELLAKDRRVFEYWGHAMSYLPMSDYRYYLPRMKRFHDPYSKWEKQRMEKFGHLMKPVLKRIQEEGPLSTSDFEPLKLERNRAAWNPRGAKVALEMLFWRGELMVTERQNFRKIYDLTERVLPKDLDRRFPDDGEQGRFFVRRALTAYGIATESEIREHLQVVSKEIISIAIRDLNESGDIRELNLEGADNSKYYVLSENLESMTGLRKRASDLYILAPFDNLIIQRDRINRLFGFDYALECYVPPNKRIHGYFVLPILYGEEFAGRMDSKADRKRETLIIQSLSFEKQFKVNDAFLAAFASRLLEMADFNNCNEIAIEKVAPTKLKKDIKRHL